MCKSFLLFGTKVLIHNPYHALHGFMFFDMVQHDGWMLVWVAMMSDNSRLDSWGAEQIVDGLFRWLKIA